MSDYDKSIHQNPDAKAWAKFFMQTISEHNPTIDGGFMIGWFANAIMAMHDHISPQPLLAELEEARKQLSEARGIIKKYVHAVSGSEIAWLDDEVSREFFEKYPDRATGAKE